MNWSLFLPLVQREGLSSIGAPFVRLLLCIALWKSPSVLPLKGQRDCAIKAGAYACVDHIPL